MSEEHGQGLYAERADHYQAEPPARKSMIKGVLTVFFGAAVVVGGLGGAGYWFYNQGQPAQEEGKLPILLPDPSPIKIRPEDPGGMEVPHRETTVYDQLSDVDLDANVVLQELPDMPRAPELSSSGEASNPTPAPDANGVVEATPEPEAGSEAPVETASAAETAPESNSEVSDSQESNTALAAPEITAPELTDAQKAVAAAEAKAAAQESAAPVTAPAASNTASTGDYRVQLASVRDEAGAAAEWKRLSSKNSDLLGNLQMFVQRKEIEGKGVFYRLQAGPLADGSGAEKLCADLKQRNVGCLIVRP
jgi:hypothetical protein